MPHGDTSTGPWRKDNQSIRNLSRELLKAADADHVVRRPVMELATRAGIKSKDTAYICLALLEQAGWIARRKRTWEGEGPRRMLPLETVLLPPILNQETTPASPAKKTGRRTAKGNCG